MDSLILENVRCFTKPSAARLAPLTLLIGENSTGKTTFLAATRLAWQLRASSDTPDFNEEPFSLGAYNQIANYRGGRAGRAHSFTIGFEAATPAKLLQALPGSIGPWLRMQAEFVQHNGQPSLREWKLEGGQFSLTVHKDATNKPGQRSVQLTSPSGQLTLTGGVLQNIPLQMLTDASFLRLLLEQEKSMFDISMSGSVPSAEERDVLQQIAGCLRHSTPPSLSACAPIRTEPRRTYEPINDTPRPAGAHVPMILAKAYGGSEWQQMAESLQKFGTASGLFQGIEVKRFGPQESGPFQILVKISGPPFNLVDVGYGVSQLLPIVVDILQGEKRSAFLLQQPEVHLHPRAQAELGSLLGQLVRTDKKRFIVETHSDYLLDRIRMDVRDKKGITPDDVSVLYFERRGSEVQITSLTLDADGNIEDAPSTYRNFFLQEERRFIGL